MADQDDVKDPEITEPVDDLPTAEPFDEDEAAIEAIEAGDAGDAGDADEADVAEAGDAQAAVPEPAVDVEALLAASSLPPEAPVARGSAELKAVLEALIFASPEPLTPRAIYRLLDQETREDVDAALAGLKHDYERPGGLQLVEVAGGYQIVTRPDLHEWVRRLFHERTTSKLTVAALETLAVIAYRQPVTAAEITDIRGVSASGVLNTLLERHLIKIVGRKAVVGRPFLYSTTKEFLIRFGLNDLGDLPKVEDMGETLGLDTLLVERVTEDEMLPLDEPESEGEASTDASESPGD